ncbi:uncharacterized protein LOC111405537 [Olea europaea var. sylvestris]|uniref:uncharacterized protein LOC111405537 n=1 Tax=Olea europaea var. sylvestris TaxID=158386 RepID=UPI000C1D3E23|nr:uncharacterized protein LOC111405537 [Olea europaea var. sylvestris]
MNFLAENKGKILLLLHRLPRICHDLLRIKIALFQQLCAHLRTHGLVDNRSIKVEEQVAIFLNTIGHDHRNRTRSFTFFRFGQTVSYYFRRVLQACLGLYRDVVNNATIHNSPYEKDKVKPCWEGSAHIGRLLRSATLREGHKLTIPVGKYYLVGAKFPLVPGFLAPYRRTRYHRRDIEGHQPESKKELIYDAEDLCDKDYCSIDDEVNTGHVDAPDDDTSNAPISITAEPAWCSNRDTMADDMRIAIALMAQNRRSSLGHFRVARLTTPLNGNDIDFGTLQVDPNAKTCHIRWSDEMDGYMINSLVEQVLVGHKRSDNGHTSFQVSKAIERLVNGCGVMVSKKNVRVRLKTLKKEYAEVRQLSSMSGFGLDPETGRIVANVVAWDDFIKLQFTHKVISQGKPEFGKWGTKCCLRYNEMETIFSNDGATGDHAVSGFDHFFPMNVTDESVNEVAMENVEMDPSPILGRKRTAEEGTNRVKRRRIQTVDESPIALSKIVESSTKDCSSYGNANCARYTEPCQQVVDSREARSYEPRHG